MLIVAPGVGPPPRRPWLLKLNWEAPCPPGTLMAPGSAVPRDAAVGFCVPVGGAPGFCPAGIGMTLRSDFGGFCPLEASVLADLSLSAGLSAFLVLSWSGLAGGDCCATARHGLAMATATKSAHALAPGRVI